MNKTDDIVISDPKRCRVFPEGLPLLNGLLRKCLPDNPPRFLLILLISCFLSLSPVISHAAPGGEQARFEALCKSYREGRDPQTIVAAGRDFLKTFRSYAYGQKVSYIIASCLGNTPEAVDVYLSILRRNANKNKRRNFDFISSDKALVMSALFKAGQISYDQRGYEKALEYFSRLRKRSVKDFITGETLYAIALTEFALGRFVQAEQTLTDLTRENPLYQKEEKVLFAGGSIMYQQGKYAEAYEKFRVLSDPASLYYQGKCLEKLQKYIQAVVAFRKLLTIYPESDYKQEAAFLIAECFYFSSDYASALAEYRPIADKPSIDSRFSENALFRIACCHYQRRDYEAALTAFNEVARRFPGGEFAADSRYMAADVLFARGDLEKALKAYQSVSSSESSRNDIAADASFMIAWCHTLRGEHDLAIDAASRSASVFSRHARFADFLFITAENYRMKNDPGQAVNYYKRIFNAPQKSPEHVEAALFMIARTLSEQKKYDEIISGYHYLLSSLPPSGSEWRSYSYLLIAEAYYYLGMLPESKKAYERVAAEFPYTKPAALAQEGKAWVYSRGKEYGFAEEEYKSMAEDMLLPGDSTVRVSGEFELGNVLFNQKKYAEALDAYEKFMQRYPQHELFPDALYHAGRCYYKLEYYSQAVETWEKLAAGYPEHPLRGETLGLAADTNFRAQRYPEAIRSYEAVLAGNPSPEAAKQALLRIAQSRFNLTQDGEAIRRFDAFLNAYPDDPLGDTALEGIRMASDRLPQGDRDADLEMEVLQKFLTGHPRSPLAENAQYRLAERYFEKKDYSRAAECFRNVYRAYSGKNTPDAHFRLAESLYYQELYEEAVPVYQGFIVNFPRHDDVEMACLHLANSLYHLEKYPEASQAYGSLAARKDVEEAVAVTALTNAALCFRKAAQWEEAIRTDRQLADTYPENDKAKNALLDMADLYEITKQNAKASMAYEELLLKLAADDPLCPELHFRLGESYLKEDNTAKAVEALDKLLAVRPLNDPWRLSGLARLAKVYEEARDLDKALQSYEEIARSAVDQKWVTAAREQIKAIHAAKSGK